jgi:hypothetical protein
VLGSIAGGKVVDPILHKLGIGGDGEQGEYFKPASNQQEVYNAFANDYDNQMGLADKGVQTGALSRDVYGAGGLQSQLAAEGKTLADTGFGLTQGDREAYGQTSGDISRMFGQQENQTAQSLNRRGLGGASSGAAGAAFSGLSGSKNEMLAKAQTDIAQKRMADTQQRLLQNRTLQGQLATQGTSMANDRYSTKADSLLKASQVEKGLNAQGSEALAAKKAAYKPGLLESIGSGLQSGITQTATAAPGMAMKGLFV